MDTERDLLFGLLALRAGLLEIRQFAAAWGDWDARPDLPFAVFLLERGHLTPAGKAAIEDLLEGETHGSGDAETLPAGDRVRRALTARDESETLGGSTVLL